MSATVKPRNLSVDAAQTRAVLGCRQRQAGLLSLSDLSDEEVLSPLQKVTGASQGLLVRAGLIPLHLEQHCHSECCLFLQAVCRSSLRKKCTLMQCYCGVQESSSRALSVPLLKAWSCVARLLQFKFLLLFVGFAAVFLCLQLFVYFFSGRLLHLKLLILVFLSLLVTQNSSIVLKGCKGLCTFQFIFSSPFVNSDICSQDGC